MRSRRKYYKYSLMREAGLTAKEVFLEAERDGLDFFECLPMLSSVCQISLLEAKEVMVCAHGEVSSLVEHQESLIPALEEVLRDDME